MVTSFLFGQLVCQVLELRDEGADVALRGRELTDHLDIFADGIQATRVAVRSERETTAVRVVGEHEEHVPEWHNGSVFHRSLN